ncbi:type I restriction endonuclease [Desulfovulcanus sp.]
MDFAEQLQEIAKRIEKTKEAVQTEEATKTAFVMPFIQTLGYNIFDPQEVVPEFTADIGPKKGEKVDYAIFSDGHPIILFECKACQVDLDDKLASQLRRYFHVTDARIGVLTNGIIYRFYSDLEQSNIMDKKPFMEIDFTRLEEPLIQELKKLTKSNFQLDEMLSTANELKYIREIKLFLKRQLKNPAPNFIKFLAYQVYPGRLTQSVLGQFSSIAQKAFTQFINEEISLRLQSVIDTQQEKTAEATADAEKEQQTSAKDDIVTTPEEWEGFYIVRAI